MKKYILKSLLVLFVVNFSFAQTTATDFTTDDCNGVSHNLFSELDAGNVIVISWVMPCFSCIAPSLEAYYAVQSFDTSGSPHTGRVHFYLASDDGLDPCSSFINWGGNNNMPLNTTFNSVDIDMEDYGTPGMPKVVVLGGSQHTIFYNENFQNPTFLGVQNAIIDALSAPLGIELLSNEFEILTYPNPVTNVLNISYTRNQSAIINFTIVDVLGKVALSSEEKSSYLTGNQIKSINVSALNNGNYFLEISSESIVESIPFVVSH